MPFNDKGRHRRDLIYNFVINFKTLVSILYEKLEFLKFVTKFTFFGSVATISPVDAAPLCYKIFIFNVSHIIAQTYQRYQYLTPHYNYDRNFHYIKWVNRKHVKIKTKTDIINLSPFIVSILHVFYL